MALGDLSVGRIRRDDLPTQGTPKDPRHGKPSAAREEAQESTAGRDGTMDASKTLHVYQEGPQAATCLYCGAVLTSNGRRRGLPQEFCLGTACRRRFWQEARRVGGRIMKQRRARGTRPARRRMSAATTRLVALLVAAGSVLLGVQIPADAAAWLAGRRRARTKQTEGSVGVERTAESTV